MGVQGDIWRHLQQRAELTKEASWPSLAFRIFQAFVPPKTLLQAACQMQPAAAKLRCLHQAIDQDFFSWAGQPLQQGRTGVCRGLKCQWVLSKKCYLLFLFFLSLKINYGFCSSSSSSSSCFYRLSRGCCRCHMSCPHPALPSDQWYHVHSSPDSSWQMVCRGNTMYANDCFICFVMFGMST